MLSDAVADFAAGPLTPSQKACDVARAMIAAAIDRAIAHSNSRPVAIALETVLTLETPPEASIFGRNERVSAQWAAFVNALAGQAAIVPAVLALAETAGLRNTRLIEAVIVGTEIDLRLTESVAPDHTDRGWDPAGTIAHVGAVLGAGRVLGLDAARMRHALGIAATQSAGLWAAFGTMTQTYHLAKAAADGVEAALLAHAGFTGPAAPIEGRRGFAALLAGRFRPEVVTDRLGTVFKLDQTAIESFPEHPGVRDVLARYALA